MILSSSSSWALHSRATFRAARCLRSIRSQALRARSLTASSSGRFIVCISFLFSLLSPYEGRDDLCFEKWPIPAVLRWARGVQVRVPPEFCGYFALYCVGGADVPPLLPCYACAYATSSPTRLSGHYN